MIANPGRPASGSLPPREAAPSGARRSRARGTKVRGAWDLAALAALRAAAYRMFAGSLLPPDVPRLTRLYDSAVELGRFDDALSAFAFFGLWRQLLDVAVALRAAALPELAVEHVRLFAVGAETAPCLPYEAGYLVPNGQDRGWVSATLARTYARAGLQLSPTLRESPDHAAVELEFMAYLCGRELDAWQRSAAQEGVDALAQQRAFLRVHLGRWFGAFARDVRGATAVPLYVLAVTAADAFLHHDRDLVELLLRQVGPQIGAAESRASTPATAAVAP